jgi:hypothetical protein
MYHPVLRSHAQRQIKDIGQADLVIGLPSYKNASAASHVARLALAGASRHYPHLHTVIINADAGMEAITRREVVIQAATNGHNCTVVAGRYSGLLGQGSATAALLDAGLALDAKAIIILDTNTHTVTPDWMAGLAHLIFEKKADLVTPRYQWPGFGGLLSDLIIYPLFRALWGQSVRHPAAPDFAISPALAMALLDEDIWQTEVAGFGLPPWLTTYATLGNWRVAQSALGTKRISFEGLCQSSNGHENTQAVERVVRAQFHDIVSVMLRMVYEHRNRWADVDNFNSLSTLTQFAPEIHADPAPERDPASLLDALALGWIEYRPLWQYILTPDNLARIEALAALPPDRFYFPADLWARVIYDFAVVFNKGDRDPYQIVNSLYPLYQGRLAAFWQEIAGLALVGCEGTVAAQAVDFEEMRSYLRIRWQTFQPWLHNDLIR